MPDMPFILEVIERAKVDREQAIVVGETAWKIAAAIHRPDLLTEITDSLVQAAILEGLPVEWDKP